MKKPPVVHPFGVAIFAAVFLSLAASSRFAPAADTPNHKLVIRPAKTDRWKASPQDVEKVLYSAAGELWCYFPGRTLPPILVEPKGGPIVLFDRGSNGEVRMKLNTGEQYWSQYTFQFAHEFCHILCNYKGGENPNKWFEESLCETASLFVLRQMSETWKTAAPYPNWQGYAPKLRDYAQKRIVDARLPDGQTLAQWYKLNAKDLHGTACVREKNRMIAGVLLPLFEKEPKHWEAIAWLNVTEMYKTQTFEQYLANWRYYAPERHTRFIEQIAKQFDITLPPTKR